MERVVVTGLGVVTCAGNDVPSFWDAMCNGRSGIGRIASYDPTPFPTHIAGEVRDFQLEGRQVKHMARFAQLAVGAAEEALRHAGLCDGEGAYLHDPTRAGVLVGTGIGGEPFLEAQHAKFMETGRKFHPLTVPIVIANMASGNIAMRHKLCGPNMTLSTACATGNHSIGTAADQIALGRADVMVAGGAESTISAFAIQGYHLLTALSTRNDDPQGASRPFSAGRDGFVLAEGAGVLVLESETHARARGAEILAVLQGFGLSADAYHLTAPHPEGRGVAQAMREALRGAALAPGDIDYINAHGTSTPLNDALETAAIREVFGPAADTVPVSSIKSMIGHSLGAASGIEAVASVMALHSGVLPPTINLHEPDPELTLDYVPNTARQTNPRTVMSNSFAFGGQNAVVIFTKP